MTLNLKKCNKFFLITSILTIIALTFSLYITFFKRIVSDNQGYFYGFVFGFIFVLVFLLCHLFTKLIAISTAGQESALWKIGAILVVALFGIIFFFSRMRFTSELSADDFYVFKSATGLMNDTYSSSLELISYDQSNPANFLYASILSVLFGIFGDTTEVFIRINAIIIAVSLFFIYRITSQLTDRLCGLLSAFLAIVIPSQTFAVYVFNSNPLFTLLFLINLDLIIILFVSVSGYTSMEDFNSDDSYDENELSSNWKVIVYTVLLCISNGILIYCEPVMLIPIVLLVLSAFLLKKRTALNVLIAFAVGIILFSGLSFVKSVQMDRDFGEVLTDVSKSFDFLYDQNTDSTISGSEAFDNFTSHLAIQDDCISESYYFLYTKDGEAAYTEMTSTWLLLENQLIFMFLIILALSCLFIAIKENMANLTPINIMLIGLIMMIFFSSNRFVNKHSFMTLLIVFCGISIHYMYLSHHPEQIVVVNTLDAIEKTGHDNHVKVRKKDLVAVESLSEDEFVRRAQALVFIGKDEELYRQIKSEEHRNAMRSDGHKTALENTFDDFDEDFFFDTNDTEEAVAVEIPVAGSSGNPVIEAINSASSDNLPVWKKKPEKFGQDDMFFDDADEEDEDDLNKNTSQSTNASYGYGKNDLPASSEGLTTSDPVPVVEVIKRKSEDASNNKAQTTKSKEKPVSKASSKNEPTASTIANGRAIRKVKNVGGSNDDTEVAKYLAQKEMQKKTTEPVSTVDNSEKYIPNPLPVPKKKDHKPIDFDRDDANDGWAYDYDVDDDSDWDV